MVAYREYVAIGATKKTDENANKIGGSILIIGLTSGGKELTMIMGNTEESFRKTSKSINHIRYQPESGTPSRTLHDQTQKEGTELIDHLRQKADDLNRGNFSTDGDCINPEIPRGDPISISTEKTRPVRTIEWSTQVENHGDNNQAPPTIGTRNV